MAQLSGPALIQPWQWSKRKKVPWAAAPAAGCCCLRYTIGFPPSVSCLAAVILPLSLYTLIMYIAMLRSAALSRWAHVPSRAVARGQG